MRKLLFILLLTIPVLILAAEPVRVWKDKQGRTIHATFDISKDFDPEFVPLNTGRRSFSVKYKNLSQADQEYVTRVRSSRGADSPIDDSAGAKSRGIEVVPSGKRYALLIGVNQYVKPIKSLQFCVKDMELLASCFQTSGTPRENIILVTDNSSFEYRPTGGNIRRQIETVTNIMEPDDQLVIAFSGHGVMVDGKSYLCPSDTDLKDKTSVVSRDWVFEQLEKCKAKQKVFIIDACRNEISFDGEKALGQAKTLEDPIGVGTHGFILIASCDKNQKSWEHPEIQHGVFTYFLAQGLSGAAKNEEGYVTIMSLFQYTSSKTKMFVFHKFNEAQVPTFRQGDEMTDFCLAKVESSSPVPTPPIPTPTVKPTPTPVQTPSGSLNAGARKVIVINDVEFAFRWCPPGSFMMGSPEWEKDRNSNYETQHQVRLTKGFWIMETEVTQKQWQAVLGDNPSYFEGDDLPVEKVSCDDIQRFFKKCEYLGFSLDLPTEAQWEYACRAGSTTAFFWGDALNGDKANCDGRSPYGTREKRESKGKTAPVGSYSPNAWGLYDMHGNVREWCKDQYRAFTKESVTDPFGTKHFTWKNERMYRGGSWAGSPSECRSAFRSRGIGRDAYTGFRCIMTK